MKMWLSVATGQVCLVHQSQLPSPAIKVRRKYHSTPKRLRMINSFKYNNKKLSEIEINHSFKFFLANFRFKISVVEISFR